MLTSLILVTLLQTNSSFVDNFIRGMEAGERANLIQQQAETQKAMRRYLDSLSASVQAKKPPEAVSFSNKEIQDAVARMDARHPGWDVYRQSMVRFMSLIAATGIGVDDYFDVLYFLAEHDAQQSAVNVQIEIAVKKLAAEYPDYKTYEAKIVRLMQVTPMRDNEDMLNYLEKLYVEAKFRQ